MDSTDDWMNGLNGTQLKALGMLGSGVSQEMTGKICGVDPSYISQLMARDEFRDKVVELRYEKLSRGNSIDEEVEGILGEALRKLKKNLPMAVKTSEILGIINVLGKVGKRGTGVMAGASGLGSNAGATVVINLPGVLQQKLGIDRDNRVIDVDGESLITAVGQGLQEVNMARDREKEEVRILQGNGGSNESRSDKSRVSKTSGIRQAIGAEDL